MEGWFEGFNSFELPELLKNTDINDCNAFIKEYLVPERIAVSIIEP